MNEIPESILRNTSKKNAFFQTAELVFINILNGEIFICESKHDFVLFSLRMASSLCPCRFVLNSLSHVNLIQNYQEWLPENNNHILEVYFVHRDVRLMEWVNYEQRWEKALEGCLPNGPKMYQNLFFHRMQAVSKWIKSEPTSLPHNSGKYWVHSNSTSV